MYGNNHWISYEDTDSVAQKASLVKEYGLGGVMVWSLEKDDYTNRCGTCPFTLMRAINNAVGRQIDCTFNGNGIQTTTESPGVQTTMTTSTTTTTTTSSSEDGDEIRICTETGYFKKPGDCHQYYVCVWVGFPPFTGTCPSNLYWDSQLSLCNWSCK